MSCPHCSHCHPQTIKYGVSVRFKERKRGRTNKAGIVRGHPRHNSKTVYVVWPDGWAGSVLISELVLVPVS